MSRISSRRQPMQRTRCALSVGLLIMVLSLCGCGASSNGSNDPYVQSRRARAHLENGHTAQAAHLFREVAQRHATADAWCNLGLALQVAQESQKSHDAWAKAIAIDPDHVASNYHLGAWYLQRQPDLDGDKAATTLQAAIDALEQARTFEPRNASVLRLLSQAYKMQGNDVLADSLLQAAGQQDPVRAGRVPAAFGLTQIRLPQFERSPSVTRHAPRFEAEALEAQARGLVEMPMAVPRLTSGLLLEGTRAWLRNVQVHAPENIQWAAQSLLETAVLGGVSAPFDGDASADLVLWSRPVVSKKKRRPASLRTQLWFARGSQESLQVQPLEIVGFDVRDMQAVDIDADADVDLIVAASGKPGLRVWRNDGRGGFEKDAEASWFADTAPMQRLALADLNGDAIQDLVSLDHAGAVHVWAGRRHGRFSEVTHLTGLQDVRARAIATGDLDADGLEDLLVGDDEALWIHVNRGQMVFERNAAYRDARGEWSGEQERGVPVSHIQVADFDNDGKLDVVSQHFRDPQAQRVMARRSTGTATRDIRSSKEDTAPAGANALLDVPPAVRLALWRNEGFGILTDVTVRAGLDAQRSRATPVVVADFDEDGDLDMACVGIDDRVQMLWNRNEGLNRRLVFQWADASQWHQAHGAQIEASAGRRMLQSASGQGVRSLGIGTLEGLDVLRIRWADGRTQSVVDLLGLHTGEQAQQRLVLQVQPFAAQ